MTKKLDDFNLQLTPEEIEELLKEHLDNFNNSIFYLYDDQTMDSEYGYKCSSCRDTGIIEVYGGPNIPCDCDWKC